MAPSEPAPTATRHDCVGVSYYSAWMATHRKPPVCVGFSALSRTADGVQDSQDTPQPQRREEGSEWKLICLGYSSHSSASPFSMPYCEGIEVMLEQPAPAHTDASATQRVVDASATQASSTGADPALQDSHIEGDATTQATYARLVAKAATNWGLIQTALQNQGPVKLKPLPKSFEEFQTRLMETTQRNGGRMYNGAVRIAGHAYASTVKPLAAILGLNPRPKS